MDIRGRTQGNIKLIEARNLRILKLNTVHKAIACWGLSLLITPLALAKETPQTPTKVISQTQTLDAYPEKEGVESNEISAQVAACETRFVSQDIEERFQSIQSGLEADYANGLPRQIKTDLIRVRDDIDQLSSKLFDVNKNNSQEINHIVQLTIDYLEKMISLIPKAHRIAPQVREQYVLPFTTISSIRAEYQDCLAQAKMQENQSRPLASASDKEQNKFHHLTVELEQLNNHLYTLQTSKVHRFITYRAKMLRQLELYNKQKVDGEKLTKQIPKMIHKVHQEIEKMLPALELSKDYLTLAH